MGSDITGIKGLHLDMGREGGVETGRLFPVILLLNVQFVFLRVHPKQYRYLNAS